MTGYIKLYRKIQDHWLWRSDKPFDRRSAWLDILLLANHKKTKVYFNNELLEVARGEHITSEIKLAERWNWSRSKVRRFLELMEQEKMLEVIRKDKKRTRLRVLHYSDYQDTVNNTKTTEEQQKDINKNEKNDKNEKKDLNNIVLEDEVKKIYQRLPDYWEEIFRDYIEIYRAKNKTGVISPNKHYRLLSELDKIFRSLKFKFDGREYELTEDIFQEGLEVIINKRIDSLNYAKKVWISRLEDQDRRTSLEFNEPEEGIYDEIETNEEEILVWMKEIGYNEEFSQ